MGDISELARRLAPFAGADADEVAQRLIAIYGSSGRALASSRDALAAALPGRAAIADIISAARDLADYGSLALVRGEPVRIEDAGFLDYLQRMLGQEEEERMLGIFLDRGGRFLRAEWLSFGSATLVEISCRPVVARVLELGARGLILAHNHPSGDLRSSPADILSTGFLKAILAALDCELRDHLIVGPVGCLSMALEGSL